MILDFQGKRPKLDATVYIAPNATVIGDVELGSETNVWFYSLVRGDVNAIRIGARCNIQDGCILHVGRNRFPLDLEDDVILGHRVTVHGCRVGRGAMIGIGATVLNGAIIGEEAMVGAGAVVTPGSVIPPRVLALGIPAKPARELVERDFTAMRRIRESYRSLMTIYMNMPDGTGTEAPPP
jgi:carbonic anhydrase/acetyltransferase-like protein (isoleucine patch superfamily)